MVETIVIYTSGAWIFFLILDSHFKNYTKLAFIWPILLIGLFMLLIVKVVFLIYWSIRELGYLLFSFLAAYWDL